jgi:hypothetical protein
MKMVKVGGKEVPFFAADGKGGNDLRKAMYGMKMKRAEEGTKVNGYNTTVLGGQYTSDSPYGDLRRRTVSEGSLNTAILVREFNDRLEYFMEKYPSMDIEDARQEVMNQMGQDNGFMSRIDLMETARRSRPSNTQAGKRLMMGAGGLVKQYDEGGEVNGNPAGKFFIAAGRDNRGDDPSGREIAAIFMRTPEGAKQIDPKDLLEMYPQAEGDVMKAYQMAGINAKRSGEGVMFPDMKDGQSNRALMNEFGVENMDDFRDKLGIGPVNFERQRDMRKLKPGFDESQEFI